MTNVGYTNNYILSLLMFALLLLCVRERVRSLNRCFILFHFALSLSHCDCYSQILITNRGCFQDYFGCRGLWCDIVWLLFTCREKDGKNLQQHARISIVNSGRSWKMAKCLFFFLFFLFLPCRPSILCGGQTTRMRKKNCTKIFAFVSSHRA